MIEVILNDRLGKKVSCPCMQLPRPPKPIAYHNPSIPP